MDCVCKEVDNGSNIRVDCTTGNRCHDHGKSYKPGQHWYKTDARDQMQKEHGTSDDIFDSEKTRDSLWPLELI